ncbi:hypothetical protein OAB47_00545 [Vicingaceae bacterium]|nr:hypothetical protein [Vicingaceae bacterium]
MKIYHLISVLLLFVGLQSQGQELSTYVEKEIKVTNDSIQLDSLSIAANSELLLFKELPLNDTQFKIDYISSQLIIFDSSLFNQTLSISYRFIDFDFNAVYKNQDIKNIQLEDPGLPNFYSIRPDENRENEFDLGGLNKSGSISRGISFGNNQNLSVNSNLDLQLSGKLTEDISIRAVISDDNIPIQAEGNTQQLREFDQVFIQLYNDQFELTAGDFRMQRPNSYFMNFDKKVQGGSIKAQFFLDKNTDKKETDRAVLKSEISAAVSRGKFARNVLSNGQPNGGIGTEGNQGPFRLRGAENETFIIILSGTEKIFLNGQLMKRGQDFDYIIDYNTGEVTFTPNQLITKDSRIIAEFQYAERNYARSLVYSNQTFEKKNLSVRFNIYSEQDNKNQPLLQELNSSNKQLLSSIGDSLELALVSGIDTIEEFENDQVLYKQIDSLGFTNILVYSIDPDSAKFRVQFSEVSAGEGDYVRIQSAANGRVFKWVAPVGGVKQGNFIPFIQLISPKRTQMATIGATYLIGKTTTINIEGALTRRDLNTFSNKDDQDDNGYGFDIQLDHKSIINKKRKSNTSFLGGLHYEQRGANFNPIERYRDVEFERDWNLSSLNLQGSQQLGSAYSGLEFGNNGQLVYNFSFFKNENSYQGLKHAYRGLYKKNGFEIKSDGSLLTTEGVTNSYFLRHYTTISKGISKFIIGVYGDQEKAYFRLDSNRISKASNDKLEWKAFIKTADTSTNSYEISYSQRFDYLPTDTRLDLANKAEEFSLLFLLAKNQKGRLKGQATYRRLKLVDSTLSELTPENTLIGRLEYDLKALKGFISSNTFYEISSGLENKREFSYLKVADGQGIYLWNDYNNNGVKELNEFEIAGENNSFQANYIRIFTPTNEYVKVYSNQFNQVIFIRPEVFFNDKKGLLGVISKLSNKTAYRAERKTSRNEDIYNPFVTPIDDSTLVSVGSTISNTFYINRLGTKFGTDLFYQTNKSKSLLTNGVESRSSENREIRSRYNATNSITFNSIVAWNNKSNTSELFPARNFNIESLELEPRISYQPGVAFRLSLLGSYTDKNNRLGEERAFTRSVGTEMQYSKAGKGTFTIDIRFISIDFNSGSNSALSFEMLEGLQAGGNTTWSLNLQRNLSKVLQLSVNYSGRKSENINTIHTGGMQLRAFF